MHIGSYSIGSFIVLPHHIAALAHLFPGTKVHQDWRVGTRLVVGGLQSSHMRLLACAAVGRTPPCMDLAPSWIFKMITDGAGIDKLESTQVHGTSLMFQHLNVCRHLNGLYAIVCPHKRFGLLDDVEASKSLT